MCLPDKNKSVSLHGHCTTERRVRKWDKKVRRYMIQDDSRRWIWRGREHQWHAMKDYSTDEWLQQEMLRHWQWTAGCGYPRLTWSRTMRQFNIGLCYIPQVVMLRKSLLEEGSGNSPARLGRMMEMMMMQWVTFSAEACKGLPIYA